MMIGRLGDSDGEAWPCWPFSASTSGMAACTPVPAATAPSTDVFTKSRRENVTSPPDVRLAKKIIYKKITSGVAGEPGSISRATNGFTRNAVSASKGDPLSSKSIRSKEKAKKLCGSLHPPPRARRPRDSRQDAGAILTCWRISASGRDRPSLPSVVDLQQQWKSAAHSPIGNAAVPRYFTPCRTRDHL